MAACNWKTGEIYPTSFPDRIAHSTATLGLGLADRCDGVTAYLRSLRQGDVHRAGWQQRPMMASFCRALVGNAVKDTRAFTA
jgi:hypothetical protein